MGGWLIIWAEVAVVAAGAAVGFSWLWQKTRRAKKTIEDRFVGFYAESLEGVAKTLANQEQAVERLRMSARELGLDKDHSFSDRILQVQTSVSVSRGEHGAVAHAGDAGKANLDLFCKVKSDCDANWPRIFQIFLEMFSRPVKLLRELSEMEQQRQSKLSSATRRIEELEKQVDGVTRQELATDDPVSQMESRWQTVFEDCKRQDDSHQKTIHTLGRDLDNLEGINKRLSSVMQKLRDRQKTLAERLQELQGLAEMTPKLQQELAQLTMENQALQSEIREMEESRNTLQQEIDKLRTIIEEMKAQPPRLQVAEAQASEDRQILHLLREQNQRLVLELEEARDINDELQNQLKSSGKKPDEDLLDQVKQMQAENTQLLEEFEQLQVSLEAKNKEIHRLNNKLRELGIVEANAKS